MGYKIFLSPEALSDLEGVVMAVLMAQSQPGDAGAGARSANQLLDEALSLSRAPERGQIVPELGRPDLREIRHRHQRIVYRLNAARQSVEIVRVLLDSDFLRVPDPPSMSGNGLSMTHGEDNEAQARLRLELLPTPLSFKTPKEIILEVAASLLPNATLYEAIRELEFRSRVLDGLASLEDEERTTLEDARKQIPLWITKSFYPPPR